jgi:alpha-tubulin suppressor-like RCC1 family protein
VAISAALHLDHEAVSHSQNHVAPGESFSRQQASHPRVDNPIDRNGRLIMIIVICVIALASILARRLARRAIGSEMAARCSHCLQRSIAWAEWVIGQPAQARRRFGARRAYGCPRTPTPIISAAVALVALALGVLLLPWGGAQALAACSGPCSAESKLTGLAHPPAWAAGKRVHFAPSSTAASAYAQQAPPAPVLARGVPHLLINGLEEAKGGERNGPLVYHEGAGIQESPKVYLIFWGNNFSTTQAGQEAHETLLSLFQNLSHSESGRAWQGVLTQYFDSKGRVSRTVQATPYVDERVAAPQSVNTVSLEHEIAEAIAANGWPPELNAQFMILPAPGSTYEASFAKNFCAYHGVLANGTIYSFVGYPGDQPFRGIGCLNSDPAKIPAHVVSKTASHEYAEAVTDPVPGPGTREWTTGEPGAEIGDLCQRGGIFELQPGGWVQGLYDNSLKECSHEHLEPADVYATTDTVNEEAVGAHEATLTGVVNAEGAEARYFFEYGTSASYGSAGPEEVTAPSESNEDVHASQMITGLEPETTYHYRLVARNTAGSEVKGEDRTFTTIAALAPSVTSVAPSEGPEAGGISVTIAGTNLATVTAVKFGSFNAEHFTINSNTSITVLSPKGRGVVNVTVTNPSGTSPIAPASRFAYGLSPTVIEVQPHRGPDVGGTSVTITGTNFSGTTAVKFGSKEASSFTVAPSGTSIVAVSPAGTGTVGVTVTNFRATSAVGEGPSKHFEYLPDPSISEVRPHVGAAAGGTSVVITGVHLAGATAVMFGTTAAKVVGVTDTAITAISPAGTGSVDVTVTNATGTSVIVPADRFTYEAASGAAAPMAWGSNGSGQLGNESTENSALPVALRGLGGVKEVSAGGDFSLALLNNGTVWAWGANDRGQLGDGSTKESYVPVEVTGLKEVKAISAGAYHSLALLRNGTVVAWGDNHYGMLGDNTTTNRDAPVPVGELREVKAVSAGEEHSMALQANGTVKAWGINIDGELGNGTTKNSHVPVSVSGLSEVAAISAGGGFSLALQINGTVKAWGVNVYGELGNGATTTSDVPVAVSGLSEAIAISAGGDFSLALQANGTVKAWGANERGELGNGTTTNSNVPVAVNGLSEAIAISAGGNFGLALQAGGTVKAWGSGGNGQLGSASEESYVPVTVSGLSGVTAISAGAEHGLTIG